ncbi:extracellular solute-binding protein [Lederbergia citri]|nr:extracellular solute-binding protein [Lederbergia citri]
MRKAVIFFGTLFILFVLSACGKGQATGNANEPTTDPAPKVEAKSTTSDKPLIVYTNSNSDGKAEWIVEEGKKAGFNIEIVGAGGGDITNRLISEKANPVADVVFGLNHMFFEQLKAEDVLIPFAPNWAEEIEAGINDEADYYHGLVKQALILSYNPEFVEKADVPDSYLELANNEKFKGIFQARDDLGSATAKVIIASIIAQFEDPNGELGISAKGWETVERFYKNGVQIPEGEDFFSMFASGDAPIGTMISGNLAVNQEQYGTEAVFIHPEVGTPLVVESVGIVKGTKQEEVAQKFVDWFGSAETQGAFAEKFNAMPVNKGALDKASDFQRQIFDSVVPQDINWSFVTENIDDWVEKLELEIF